MASNFNNLFINFINSWSDLLDADLFLMLKLHTTLVTFIYEEEENESNHILPENPVHIKVHGLIERLRYRF